MEPKNGWQTAKVWHQNRWTKNNEKRATKNHLNWRHIEDKHLFHAGETGAFTNFVLMFEKCGVPTTVHGVHYDKHKGFEIIYI